VIVFADRRALFGGRTNRKENVKRFLVVALLAATACGSGVELTSDGGTCADTWASYGASFFNANCSGCHSNYSTHSQVQANASALSSAIAGGSMPRGIALSTSSRTEVLTYLRCGAP
jgi:mono/diheme cytochrome c family protein